MERPTARPHDYLQALGIPEQKLYFAEDSWENYDKLAPRIEAAFQRWKRSHPDR